MILIIMMNLLIVKLRVGFNKLINDLIPKDFEKKKSFVFDPEDAVMNRIKPKRTIFLQKLYDKKFKICQKCYSDKKLDIDLDINELLSILN